MESYSDCQKILVIDGKSDFVPQDFEFVEVPRVNGRFSWANMWDAGVFAAKYEKLLYLDSDRLWPEDLLHQIDYKLIDDVFLYTSQHFALQKEISLNICEKLLNDLKQTGALSVEEYWGLVKLDPRFGEPFHGSGKNVMSGGTAFTKKTYNRLGGVDPWYCGHGAFADTDFHYSAFRKGCQFIDLKLPELHLFHLKMNNTRVLTDSEIWKLSVDNFIYYCHKWNLPLRLAKKMAARSRIKNFNDYVEMVANKLNSSP